jgi:UDP-N-acetylmuramyl pentapeptide synthase
VQKAFELGAVAALVDLDWKPETGLAGLPLLRVRDTRKALQDMARAWRMKSSALIIGLTGSSGKTTTKEMTAAALSGGGVVCATEGNLNNDIGLPLSLLKLSPETPFGVFEAGMNHRGEISALADVLRPQAAVISSIGNAHIEFLGSLENIAEEKADLLRVLPRDGFAVMSLETTCFPLLARASTAPVVTTSFVTRDADFFGELVDLERGLFRIYERNNAEPIECSSVLPGLHNASNALLAFATARRAGVAAQAVVEGLKRLVMPGKLPCKGRRILVLGDMRELGTHSEALHRSVGCDVATGAPDLFIAVGEQATAFMAQEAIARGLPATRVKLAKTTQEAALFLSDFVREGDSVLLKASRGMALENVLNEG